MFDIVGIESPCVDLLLNTEKLPPKGGSSELDSCGWQGGGKVSTGMVAAARLGAKVAAAGVVGSDAPGRFCADDFKRHGIDVENLIVCKDKTTTLSVVLSDKESRSFLVKHGTCGYLQPYDLNRALLRNTRYLYISKLIPVSIEACKIARKNGADVFVDADRLSDNLMESVPLFDYFVASETVYNSLFSGGDYENNCAEIRALGPNTVIFTLGEKGCVGLSRDGFFNVPAFKVNVVDTTGAGDVFHGAFIAGLLKGWPAKEAARFASAVSAIKCTRYGGRAGIPDLQTTIRFMETGIIDYTEIDQRVEFYSKTDLLSY